MIQLHSITSLMIFHFDSQIDVTSEKLQGRNVRWKIKCSVCPAIRTDYRSLLRSSSTGNPSDPPLVVVFATWDFSSTKSALIMNGFDPSGTWLAALHTPSAKMGMKMLFKPSSLRVRNTPDTLGTRTRECENSRLGTDAHL